MGDYDQMKPATLLKIRQLDQELKTEFYKVLEEKGEEIPQLGSTIKDIPPVINKEFVERTEINEARMKRTAAKYL